MAYIKNIKEYSGKITRSVWGVLSRSSPCLPDGDHLHSAWTFWGFGPQISPSPPGLWGMTQSQSRSSSHLHPPTHIFNFHSRAPLSHNNPSPVKANFC